MRLSRWTSLGSLAGVAAAGVLWLAIARALPPLAGAATADRLGLACAALLPAAGVLNLMILVQMLLRVATGALDPQAGADGRLLRVNQRAITNTVEQVAGFAPALLALAAAAGPEAMRHVVAAGLVFAVARLVFWAGYLCGPMTRAPGMAASFAINGATWAAAAWFWLG
ncbi:MAG: MAPEG family protein [Acetobacteraceae bacterium]